MKQQCKQCHISMIHLLQIQVDEKSACREMTARSGGGRQKEPSGVLRPSGGANAVAGCWPTYGE